MKSIVLIVTWYWDGDSKPSLWFMGNSWQLFNFYLGLNLWKDCVWRVWFSWLLIHLWFLDHNTMKLLITEFFVLRFLFGISFNFHRSLRSIFYFLYCTAIKLTKKLSNSLARKKRKITLKPLCLYMINTHIYLYFLFGSSEYVSRKDVEKWTDSEAYRISGTL